MDKIKINRITNCNVYLGKNSLLGKAAEVTPPEIKYTMAEHKALGLMGPVEFFAGVEKLEAKIKWTSFYDDVMKSTGNPFKPLELQIRTSIDTYVSSGRTAQTPAVIYLTGTSVNFPLGSYKPGENIEPETTFTCTYVKVEYDGKAVYELDVLANIFKIDGVDILADYKKNIGA